MDVPQARTALEESVRRVTSIALVHETLSASLDESVDVRRGRRPGARHDRRGGRRPAVTVRRRGQLRRAAGGDGHAAGDGAHRAGAERRRARATTTSRPAPSRSGSRRARRHRLTVQVVDDGRGLPPGFEAASSRPAGASDRADPGRLRARRSARAVLAGIGWNGGHGDLRVTTRSVTRVSRSAAGCAVVQRLSAIRSSSDRPPQTPASCPLSSAHARQASVTVQRPADCLGVLRSAGVRGRSLPMGKNSSGSSSRHAAACRQSMRRPSVTVCVVPLVKSFTRCGVTQPIP